MSEADELDYSAGQDAFERGEPQAACPYCSASRGRDFWLAGWDEARRYADRPRRRKASGLDLAASIPG